MSSVTTRSGAPKHRRAFGHRVIEVDLEIKGRTVSVPFQVHVDGKVYGRGPKGGPLRRVRDPRIIGAVGAELERRRKARQG